MGVKKGVDGPMAFGGENGDSQGRNFDHTDAEGVCEGIDYPNSLVVRPAIGDSCNEGREAAFQEHRRRIR